MSENQNGANDLHVREEIVRQLELVHECGKKLGHDCDDKTWTDFAEMIEREET